MQSDRGNKPLRILSFTLVLSLSVVLGTLWPVMGTRTAGAAAPATPSASPSSFTEVDAGAIIMAVDAKQPELVKAVTEVAAEVERAWAEVWKIWPDVNPANRPRSGRPGPATTVYVQVGPGHRITDRGSGTGGTGTGVAGPWAMVPRSTLTSIGTDPTVRAGLVAEVVAAAVHAQNLSPRRTVPAKSDFVAQGVGWLVGLNVEGLDAGSRAAAVRTVSPAYSLSTVLKDWRAIPYGAEQLASFFKYVAQSYGPSKLTGICQGQPARWPSWGWFASQGIPQTLQTPLAAIQTNWERSLPQPSAETLRAAGAEVRRRRLWGLTATVGGVGLVGGLLLLGAGRKWRRRGLTGMIAVYLGLSLFEYWYGTSNIAPGAKTIIAWAESVLVIGVVLRLVTARRKGAGYAEATGRATADEPAGAPDAPVALFILGYFLMVMALRLPIYGEAREVWAKAPHIMLVLASVFFLEKGDWASLGLTLKRYKAQIILIVTGFLVFRLTCTAGSLVSSFIGSGGRIGPVVAQLGNFSPWWMPLRFFYGNFAEELFFRGYVQSRLERRFPFAVAMALQSLLFGFYHVNYNMFPPDLASMGLYIVFATVFGVQMTLLYRTTGSLWVTVVAHPLANLGVLLVGFQWTGAIVSGDAATLLAYLSRLLVSLWLIPWLLNPIARALSAGGAADPEKMSLASLRRGLAAWSGEKKLAFSRSPLISRLMTYFWVISVPLFLYLLVFSPVGGRAVFVIFLMLIGITLGLSAFARRRHRSTLKEVADSLGLDYLESQDQEKGHPLLDNLKWHYLADVYRWKLAGYHPFAVGAYRGLPVVIRRPLAVDFDLAAPDSTRIGVYVRPQIEGFIIYSAHRKPKGKRWVPTGDAAFDRRFAVAGQNSQEVLGILDAGVRQAMLGLDRVGLTGIEVSRFGVLYYEPGLVANGETVREILNALAALAGRAKGFSTE